MPTQIVQVNASAHDGEDTSSNGSQLDFDENAVGVIFVLTSAIPGGSTITAATVDFVTRNSDAGTDTALDIYLDPTTAPTDFSGGATDVSARSRTTASASWTPLDQANEATWTTTDFSSVVQERLDAESGFAISDELCVIFVSDTYQAVTRGAYSYDDTPAKAAELTLTWTEGTTVNAAVEFWGEGRLAAYSPTASIELFAAAEMYGAGQLQASATRYVEQLAAVEFHGDGRLIAAAGLPSFSAYVEMWGDGWLQATASRITNQYAAAEMRGDARLAASGQWMNSVLSSSRISEAVPLAVGQPADDLAASVPMASGAVDTGL